MRPRSRVRTGRRLAAWTAALTTGILLLASAPAAAQLSHDDHAAPNTAAFYRVLGPETFEDVAAIADTGASIEEITDGRVYVTAIPDEVAAIQALGFTLEELATPDSHGHPEDFPPGYSGYHNYAELIAAINQVVADHPTIAAPVSIGTSYEGRDLPVIKISDNVGTDEDEPEVLFNAQPARPRAPDRRDGALPHEPLHRRVRHRSPDHQPGQHPRDLDRPEHEPGRRRVRHRHRLLPVLAQEPAAQLGLVRRRHRPEPQLGLQLGLLRRLLRHAPASETYRGPSPFSAPETARLRDFVNSRVIGGVQQIKANIDFHTYSRAGALAVRLHLRRTPRRDSNADARRRPSATIGPGRWRPPTATPRSRPATCTSPTGRSSTGCGTTHGIFAYTFEMYPVGSGGGGFYPPDERDRPARPPATARRCCSWPSTPTARTGRSARSTSTAAAAAAVDRPSGRTTSRPNRGWTVNPNGTDTATTGQWERGNPQPTNYSGTPQQLDNPTAGSLRPGHRATGRIGPRTYDVDGGVTSVRSPAITLPASGTDDAVGLAGIWRTAEQLVVRGLLPRQRSCTPVARPPCSTRPVPPATGRRAGATAGRPDAVRRPVGADPDRGRRRRRRQPGGGGGRRRQDHGHGHPLRHFLIPIGAPDAGRLLAR